MDPKAIFRLFQQTQPKKNSQKSNSILGVTCGHDASASVIVDGKIASHVLAERVTGRRHDFGMRKVLIKEALSEAGLSEIDIDYCAVTATQCMPLLLNDRAYFNFHAVPKAKLDLSVDKPLKQIISSPYWQDRSGHLVLTRAWKGNGEPNQKWVTDGANSFLKSIEENRRIPQSSLQEWEVVHYLSPIYGPEHWAYPSSLNLLPQKVSLVLNDYGLGIRENLHHHISVRLGAKTVPGVFVNHHAAHGASTYYSSPFTDALVFTHDGGVGEDSGLLLRGVGNRLFSLLPHYLECGQFYDYAAVRCGLSAIGGAGKLMGLASYGKAGLFSAEEAGTIADWKEWRHAKGRGSMELYESIVETWLEKAKERGDDVSAFGKTDSPDKDQVTCDIAYATQELFNTSIKGTIDAVRKGYGQAGQPIPPNLCLSGGTALNCPTNTDLFLNGGFSSMHVEPHCDDGGLSIGAAWWLYHNMLGQPFNPVKTQYSSQAYLGVDRMKFLNQDLLDYSGSIYWEEVSDIAGAIAADISKDLIVAIYQSKSETGPRALGSRSILANVENNDNWRRVNLLKGRELWRPFAPMCLIDDLSKWFENGPASSPFMLFTHNVKKEVMGRLPAITHVDGTARVQTVTRADGVIYESLEKLKSLTGIGVVLNTSFNGPGSPIVETPQQAIEFLINSELDALFIGKFRVTRSARGITNQPEISVTDECL